MVSVLVAERRLGDILAVLPNSDANHGLYYLLLHAWMWGGDSEAWVRLFSALPAVAAIPITAILARRLFGDAVGLVAGFLMVGSMFVVAQAQNARAYALALLLITVATLLFVEAVRSRRPGHFIAYGAASALAVYASSLSGLVLVAHAASLAFLPQFRSLARPFALTYAAVLVAVAPLATLVSATASEQLWWLERPGWREALGEASQILGGPNTLQTIAYGPLVVIGLIALWRNRVTGDGRAETWRWRRSLVIGWLLLPPVLLFVLSQVEFPFGARFLLTSAPALAITAAIGLVAIARRWQVAAVAAATVVICVSVLARSSLQPGISGGTGGTEPYRAPAQMIASQSRTGDGLAGAWARLGIKWYLEREAMPGADPPADFALAAEGQQVGELYANREVSPPILVSRLRRYQRVWLVTSEAHPRAREGLGWGRESGTGGSRQPMLDAGLPVLHSEYRRVRGYDFGVVRVELYEREPGR
jgi:mannosyltransferase